ncbi:MAG TPA: hypothetical protein VGT02_11110 [Methylomirabilota bacterium]|jgi:hypothetical protein|nr:hypothetical protein [Methylomirabilota bacterium]
MRLARAVAASMLLLCAHAALTSAAPGTPPRSAGIPEVGRWETQMVRFGRATCDYLAGAHTPDELLAAVYYDALRVFYRIGDYTRDAAWTACAQRARAIYRDRYVLRNKGVVPGYWNFTDGLTMDHQRTGDPASKEAALLLSERAAYAADSTALAATQSPVRSREVAYAIMSYINAETLGAPPRARLPRLTDQALGHLDQWFGSKSYRCPRDCDPAQAAGQYYIQPFMVALTSEALIRQFERTGDPRIPPAIKTALDWLWANAWVPADRAFWYENWAPDGSRPLAPRPGAPDLNLLLAPAYAWLHRQTGDAAYRRQADQIFAGGVTRANLGSGKHFNQNYRVSFDYVALRAAAGPPSSRASMLSAPRGR